MMRAVHSLGALGLVATLAAPVAAQQHRHNPDRPSGPAASCSAMQGMMTMGGMMSSPQGQAMPGTGAMMEVMRFNPRHLLAQRSQLGLDPTQVTRLEALAQGLTNGAGMGSMMAMGHQLRQAMSQRADTATLRTTAESFAAARARVMAAHIVAAAQARQVLSEEQRDKVTAGSPHCPGTGMMSSGMMGSGGMGSKPMGPGWTS